MSAERLPRIGLVSLGCPRNLVDSEVMLGVLERRGFRRTADAREAEVIVVNTCGFIDAAKRESIDTILEMARHKEAGTCRRLVVTGCLAQRYGEQLRREIPEIDAMLGVADIERIAAACRLDPGETPGLTGLPAYLPTHLTPRVLSTPPGSAYLKISEGCDHECAFCVIPKIRGRMRSRPAASLVEESRRLAARGVRELNLVGEDTSAYGRDRDGEETLGALLRALARVEGIEWIRVLYAYPFQLGDDVLEAMAAERRICRYLDVPLQHADRQILKRMRRGGDAGSLLRFLERLRAAVPEITLRSTFIVGFPGEREAHYRRLLEFVREARLDRVGVFAYSHEESTAAHDLPDDVPAAVKQERRERLMLLQQGIALAANRRLLGRHERVLVEPPAPDATGRGRLESQAPEVDGCVRLAGARARSGTFATVRIDSAGPYDLFGTIVPDPRPHAEPV
ncbi:MAG: 30S ribosomal protein S12 methylthiotransferase RimO [Acidobacteria bacterium]|nr:30S ribosomal protein S12 methylthiotransferase RimO [Acidobacteriota bacterium]